MRWPATPTGSPAWASTRTPGRIDGRFVDAVGWLEERGVLRLADGSSASWAGDPGAGEALYDIARDVVFALFRPPRVLQHVDSVAALLERSMSRSGNADRRAAAQAARRAVVDRPVVYYADVTTEVANHLRGSALPADLYRLTGLRVERRAEGVLLVDTVRLSAERFPGTGSVAQAAVLLATAMADRAVGPGRAPGPADVRARPGCGAGRPRRPGRRRSAPRHPGRDRRRGRVPPTTRPVRTTAAFRSSPTASCRTPSPASSIGTGRRSVRPGTPTRSGCAARRWRCSSVSARSSPCPAGCWCARWSAATATPSPKSVNEHCSKDGHVSRFAPTRAGIINLWDYRDEEFLFVDGWLVLRGPNGSGKTKALEVLFPFVLDGRIEPRRLNPFAGEDRTMKSNLLYRGQESAHAYVWMEFGDGTRHVTIGIGLRAHKHNDRVTRWHFVAEGRVGVELSLLDADDRPLARKELVDGARRRGGTRLG